MLTLAKYVVMLLCAHFKGLYIVYTTAQIIYRNIYTKLCVRHKSRIDSAVHPTNIEKYLMIHVSGHADKTHIYILYITEYSPYIRQII